MNTYESPQVQTSDVISSAKRLRGRATSLKPSHQANGKKCRRKLSRLLKIYDTAPERIDEPKLQAIQREMKYLNHCVFRPEPTKAVPLNYYSAGYDDLEADLPEGEELEQICQELAHEQRPKHPIMRWDELESEMEQVYRRRTLIKRTGQKNRLTIFEIVNSPYRRN